MLEFNKLKILFVQRVITGYRLDLLKLLCNDFQEVGIITSKGDKQGTLKLAKFHSAKDTYNNLNIHVLPSWRVRYGGESRTTNIFLYPKAISLINKYDIIVFEGTTNLFNNVYLLPYAKLLKKKTVWWDAGYSLQKRSFRRKIIDVVIKPFIRMTDAQIVYSTLAKNYLKKYMGAKNVVLNLNTINTDYFEKHIDEIKSNNIGYKFNKKHIKLLFVGVVEKRKKIKELIDIVVRLNRDELLDKNYSLQIIGGGNQLEELKQYASTLDEINLFGPIYNKETLKHHYFNSDLFVLPGDGGLAIVQSLLFGLPVLSIEGADGTEYDYITDDNFLVKDLNQIEKFLINLDSINRIEIYNNTPNLYSKKWVEVLQNELKKILRN